MNTLKQKIADEYALSFPEGKKHILDSVKDVKENCKNMIEGLNENRIVHRIHSGIKHIDDKQQGYDITDYIILGAAQSVGKTSYILNLIVNQLKNGVRVGFFTCEMLRQKIINLVACQVAGVDCNDYELNNLKNTEKENIVKANEWLYDQPLFIEDSSRTWEELREKIKIMSLLKQCDVIYIDYLQYLRTPRAQNLYERLQIISTEIKDLAKEIKTPVFVIAQLNREGKKSERPPCANDLKGNSDIEYDADVIILMHTLMAAVDGDFSKRIVEFIVDKNRNGKLGKYKLEFNCALRRFKEII